MAYYVKYRKWWDTKSFSQAGQLFAEAEKNGAPMYCPFPKDSRAYREFWDEQIYYIHNGYFHDGQRTSGLHYLYQNFCPIPLKREKRTSFPYFYAIDAEYFLDLEKCLGLGPWEGVDPFRPVVFEVSKTRQSGFSLKGCVPLIYNIQFVPDSVNYLGAWLDKDAMKTLNMFHTYFRHHFRYTDFGKRWVEQEKGMRFRTGFKEEVAGETVMSGFNSYLEVVSFKDNPDKGVGGKCDLFIIEEAGLHPKVDVSVNFILPACVDGSYTTGNIILYGAAGLTISKALENVHNNIKLYRGYAKPNLWAEPKERIHAETGLFIPNYSCRPESLDADGNPDCAQAIINRDKEFEETKKKNHAKWLIDLSQNPNTPQEMFNSRGSKRFPQELIKRQIAWITANLGQPGDEVVLSKHPTTGKIEMQYGNDGHPAIVDFPLSEEADKHGCVVIYEPPSDRKIKGLYISSIDSYNQEQSATSTSLGHIIIYKKVNTLEGTSRIIVAEYIGRPESKHTFYTICRYLLELYNAMCLPENEDQELTPWFINNDCEHLLADQPDIIRQYIPNSTVKRLKGIHADDKLIIPAENKILRYLTEKLGTLYNEQGQEIGTKYGVNRILSLGILRELAEYSSENWRNFDRVRTLGWVLMYETETENQEAEEESEDEANFLSGTDRFNGNGPAHWQNLPKYGLKQNEEVAESEFAL